MIVKFCGLKRLVDVEMCNKLQPDMIGLIFAQSPRRVEKDIAKDMILAKSPSIKSVGVFKDQNISEVIEIATQLQLDFVQLHGREDCEYIKHLKNLGFRVIKAIEVKGQEDIKIAKRYVEIADFVLLDRPKDSSLDITKVAKLADFDYIIAGGITPENIDKYLNLNPVGIDVSSGIETEGYKDFAKMKKIIDMVNKYKVGEIENG
ncbi:phosphoribosylanthranilate isomerase [Anaerocellum diazotrophicum]|uniref:N-(5'-phosphoribosyl)anthranilate isomerase n=1 Tax=Caldicellulosiruptor diazotrophicus TaxID=2806205 RepID=A0ABM7NLC0_9FIRM|nr:phosphoribosylanthranilate isomerase [Caldicellulosiruptor diazotrophicus]BCS80886.1 N-(5'-phosphoribosyl)anthranilate isomerase [Caldicellulosiruptor diazotrophicus]